MSGLQTTVSATVTVNHEAIPPTVSLTAPAEGAWLSGTVTLEALASDDSGIRGVSFYSETASGTRHLGDDTEAPYSLAWDTRTVPNGLQHVTARARDTYWNEAVSAAVAVTVDNGPVPPSVSLVTPSNGASLAQTVTLTARATDNVGIARVDFYLGDTLLGSDTDVSSSTGGVYALEWNTRVHVNGTYTLTARAFDLEGLESTSAQLAVTLNNDFVPPVVALTSPVNGAILTGPQTLRATASDDRQLARVEFCDGTGCFAQDSTAPYEFQFPASRFPNGPRVFTARAHDLSGNMTSSAPVSVTLDNEFVLPTVSITSPLEGAQVDGTVSIQVSASDNVAVTRVECSAPGVFLGQDSTAPYTFSWNTLGLTDGSSSTLLCTAYDPTGNSALATRRVVIHRNPPPTVSISAPLGGSLVSGYVTFRALASDDTGIARVEFYADNTLIGQDTTAPYEVMWNSWPYTNGSHFLRAYAINTLGLGASSFATVSLHNPIDISAPSISNVQPAASSVVQGLLSLAALVTDDNGVTRVQFSVDGTLIGTRDINPPCAPSSRPSPGTPAPWPTASTPCPCRPGT